MSHSAAMRLVFAALLAWVFVGGCDGRDDLDGRRRPIPGLEPSEQQAVEPGTDEKQLAFDFLDNRAAVTVYANGALTSSGRGIAFALLSGGGGAGNWRLGSGTRPTARVDGQVANVFFPFDKDPGGISVSGQTVPLALRFRPAARDQLVSVFLNDTKVGDVPMTEVGTAVYSVDVPTSLLREGENDLRLFYRYAVVDEGLRTAGSLERISIGSSSAPTTAPVQAKAVERGGRRLEALSCAVPARLSYYVRVPPTRPTLALNVAGKGSASVRVAKGGAGVGASREVWKAALGPGWKAVEIDLSELAGQLVRVDFLGEGPTDWGRPQLLSEPTDTPSPASSAATPHVIVWIVSGLRRDALHESSPMPALRSLAARGGRFDAVSRNPSPTDAALEVLTGRRHRGGVVGASVETLAERFRGAGYKTAMYSNAPALAGDNQGFDRVIRATTMDAATVWKRAQASLKANASTRTFTVIWTNEPALPWAPGSARLAPQWRNYVGRVQPSATKWLSAQVRGGSPPLIARDKDYVRALYRGELAAVDGAIATMVADIDALELTESTGIIVIGDRGQELFERKGFGEPTSLAAESRLVPFVVTAPGRAPIREAGLVVTADAFATALDLGQIPAPASSDGLSIYLSSRPFRASLLRLTGRARGLATTGATWVETGRAGPELFVRQEDGEEVSVEPSTDVVTSRALITWMSLLGAVGRWDARRWGRVTSLRPAFASEHGGL